MKKFMYVIAILIFFFLAMFAAYGKEYESPMSMYKDNYFIAGGTDDQVKFQVSAKYNIFYPANIGVYVAYSQTSWWKLYDYSSPFYESNYMPEAFWEFTSGDNCFNNYKMPYVDYIRISPIYHRSNGRGDEY